MGPRAQHRLVLKARVRRKSLDAGKEINGYNSYSR
jgi:hypothetical protein